MVALSYVGQQLTIFLGSFLVIIGVIGNTINIVVFSSVRSYRTIPCTFYFLIGSCFDIAYIMINLVSRIVISGVGVDLTRTSVSWCKLRNFFLATISLMSLSCSCLATIDQFLSTSQNASLRHLSSIKWAPRILMIMSIIWCCHGIPYLLFYDISAITHTCISTNFAFAVYFPSIYILTLNCAIPVSIMVVFGYLAYRNIRLTRALANRHADRQLTRMVLIEAGLVAISYIQYGINGTYTVITSGMSKDQNRLQAEYFASTVANLMCYLYFSVDSFCYSYIREEWFRFREVVMYFCSRRVVFVERSKSNSCFGEKEIR